MIGQTKSYSKHQDIVDRFLEETNPYTPGTTVPFDLHGYLDYASEHHIDDPDSIPEDVMKRFFDHTESNNSEAS